MRNHGLVMCVCAWMLLACQVTLPSATRTEATAYPALDAPTPTLNGYPDPTMPVAPDTNGGVTDPTIPLLPTAVPGAAVPLVQPLSDGIDISQPGVYTVQIIPLDDPYMVRAQTATNQIDVALAGVLVKDLGNPTCNALVKTRLDLLTSNPAATYTLEVLGANPMRAGTVIAKITRHDNIDLALDLLAAGYATLTSDPPPGFEQYMTMRDAARGDLIGMWNEGECKFTAIFLQGQDA